MQIDLTNSIAIITGGGRGIGRTIASTLAAEGVRTAVFDVDKENLDLVAESFHERGWEGLFRICDIRDFGAVAQAVSDVVASYGGIDILVNNAGVGGGGRVDEMTEERWQLAIDVNLTGTFHLCKAVIPYMKSHGSGRIINAASYAAITPSYGGAAYAASKAGVNYLTKVLAGELGPWGITANCYAPGMLPTEMNHFGELPAERQDRLLDMLSLRRWGEAEDVARLVTFLASDAASYITGALIDISGGKLSIQQPQVAYEHYRAEMQGPWTD